MPPQETMILPRLSKPGISKGNIHHFTSEMITRVLEMLTWPVEERRNGVVTS